MGGRVAIPAGGPAAGGRVAGGRVCGRERTRAPACADPPGWARADATGDEGELIP